MFKKSLPAKIVVIITILIAASLITSAFFSTKTAKKHFESLSDSKYVTGSLLIPSSVKNEMSCFSLTDGLPKMPEL